MCAARSLPRGYCAVRLNSCRRYAPMLPWLDVARFGRGRVVALRPCCYFGAGPVAARHDHHQHHAAAVRRDRAHLPPALPPLFGAARCRAVLAMIAIIILICTIYYTYNIVQYGMIINRLRTVSDGQYGIFSGNF